MLQIGDNVKLAPRRKERLSGKIGTIVKIIGQDTPKAILYRIEVDEKVYSFWGHEVEKQ